MNAAELKKFTEWFVNLLASFEDFFHRFQEWWDTGSWSQRVMEELGK